MTYAHEHVSMSSRSRGSLLIKIHLGVEIQLVPKHSVNVLIFRFMDLFYIIRIIGLWEFKTEIL